MSSMDQREEARYRQEVLASYRAWLAYLEAQQTLLATTAEAQAGADPFEGMSEMQERAESARQRLATLSADKRELFDAIAEAEQQQIQRQLDAEAPLRGGTVKRADPEEVARRALSRLHEDARGLHRDDRRGLVPRGKPDAVKWLALDLTEIAQARPSETDYQLAGERPRARRSIVLNLVFAALALAGIPVLLLLLQQPVRQATTLRQPMTNDAALSLWPILTVGESEGGPRLPVRTVTASWPAECGAGTPEQACWLQHSYRPVRLCLPAAFLDKLIGPSLEAGGSMPTRVYQLTREATTRPDLIINPCGEVSTKVATRYGYMLGLDEPITLAPGADSNEGFRLTTITVIGRGARPDLPEGRMVVSVALEESGEVRDWGALAPRLLLENGDIALPSERRREGETVLLDYQVEEQLEAFDVLWQVTGADQIVRYRATLEPPPSRDAVLRAALRIEDLVVTPSQQTMAVQLTLHNAATIPLVVEPTDFGFQTTATRREVAAPRLQQPLASGERRTISLDLLLESGTLQIGPFRYQLTVRR